MPIAMHSYYLREMYLKNKLVQPGEITLNGIPVDLSGIKIPIFLQSSKDDHIAPYPSVYKATRHYSGPVTFMLAGSGHIAGVVNHPDKNKYHHSTNTALPDTLDEWKANAERHPGSWWPYWIKWLNKVSPGKTEARVPGDGKLDIIEDAPGSYVKVKA